MILCNANFIDTSSEGYLERSLERVTMAYDIVTEIRRQLPRTIVDKLAVQVMSDPFHLRTTVRFSLIEGLSCNIWTCELMQERQDGRLIACKIPDVMLARLCLEVP